MKSQPAAEAEATLSSSPDGSPANAPGGDAEALECLHYVLYERAGSSPKIFPNSPYPRDCDENGGRGDRLTSAGEPMTFADFVEHANSRRAQLSDAHVLALRLYTTAAFAAINDPLRALAARPRGSRRRGRRW